MVSKLFSRVDLAIPLLICQTPSEQNTMVKNIEKDKDINIFQEVRNNDCLDGEKLSNIKNEKFSFKSFLPLNQLKSLLYFNSSKNNIDKELLDPQNISPELREEVDSFEDEMIENQNTIIGYDKSSIDKPKENSSE